MRVAFAGTPEFARGTLAALHSDGFDLPLVLTQPDRPAGRGMNTQPSPVKTLALEHGLALTQPRSLRLDGKYADDAQAAREALASAQPDVIVVAAYGLILPAWVIEFPRLGCINIHASLLPRWRGAAPIQRAIEAGDATTGITIMQMDTGLDTGAILLAERMPIEPDDTAGSLQARLAVLGALLIVQTLRRADGSPLPRVAQPARGVTYAAKIDKAEAAVNWAQPAAVIERKLRALDPAPGANSRLGGEVVKLWRAHVRPRVAAVPGEVVEATSGGIVVACGEDALCVTELQRAGGRRRPAADFLAACRAAVAGARFESPADAA